MSNVKINRLEENVRYFTLYDKTTIPDPTYLFSFTSASTEGITKNFICIDEQEASLLADGAWNKFTIDEVAAADEDLVNGSVCLIPEGQWNYKIYAQSSNSNLDPDEADELVEEGIAFVKGSDHATFTEYSNQPLTEKSYSPES